MAGRASKREQILAAAAPVFGRDGYERASIDAIAAAAGVSKPTVYSHFGSKEQLFRESVADSAERLNAGSHVAIRRLDIAPDRWRDGLFELGWELTECQRSDCNRHLSRLISAEVGRDPGLFAWVWERSGGPITDTLAGRLAMLGNAGFLQVANPQVAARQFIALIGAELGELTGLGSSDVDEQRLRTAVDAGVETFLAAYAVPSDRPGGAGIADIGAAVP